MVDPKAALERALADVVKRIPYTLVPGLVAQSSDRQLEKAQHYLAYGRLASNKQDLAHAAALIIIAIADIDAEADRG